MLEFVREAGFGIWPILGFGLLTVVLAGRHAVRPHRPLVSLIVGSGIATLIFGVLGTVIGVQTSIRHLHEVADSERWIFLIGLDESLNNMVAGLVLCGLAVMLTTAGSYRQARLAPAPA